MQAMTGARWKRESERLADVELAGLTLWCACCVRYVCRVRVKPSRKAQALPVQNPV